MKKRFAEARRSCLGRQRAKDFDEWTLELARKARRINKEHRMEDKDLRSYGRDTSATTTGRGGFTREAGGACRHRDVARRAGELGVYFCCFGAKKKSGHQGPLHGSSRRPPEELEPARITRSALEFGLELPLEPNQMSRDNALASGTA